MEPFEKFHFDSLPYWTFLRFHMAANLWRIEAVHLDGERYVGITGSSPRPPWSRPLWRRGNNESRLNDAPRS